MLLAIPSTFLAAWWALFPLVNPGYLFWRGPYAGLLAFTLACEPLAFIAPMLMFHRIMLDAKFVLFEHADRLSDATVSDVRTTTNHDRATAKDTSADDGRGSQPIVVNAEAALARYRAIESMPTWPVDRRLLRNFGFRNVVLLVPLVAETLGAAGQLEGLLKMITPN
jgi:hypothetical protein